MEEYQMNNSGKHRILRGIGLAIGATGIAVGAYLLGTTKRAAYTLAGVALLITAGPMVGVTKSCVDNHYKYDREKLMYEFKRDSLNAARHEKETSLNYSTQLKQQETQYNSLREKTEKLENKVEDLKNTKVTGVPAEYSARSTSIKQNNETSAVPNNYTSSNSQTLEKIATASNISENPRDYRNIGNNTLSYYLIEADKSDGEIQVFGVNSDGSRTQLSISSKASFAMNGGPADGSYVLNNKGSRNGELYPGFLEISTPVGISGAGQYNQHLGEIQEGAFANKTGIRVPNEVYPKLAKLVDEKRTVITIHE